MKTQKTKILPAILFLLTAVAGISMFISLWNSFISGKGFVYISFVFLVLFLIGMFLLYLNFLRLISLLNKREHQSSPIEEKNSKSFENSENDSFINRPSNINLLKSAFSKPDAKQIGEKILQNLSKDFGILQGVFFIFNADKDSFVPAASFALEIDKPPVEFASGEGITGQAVLDNKIVVLANLPDSYSPVISGLGRGKAKFLYIVPLVNEKKSLGVIEFTVFKEIDDSQFSALNQLMRDGGSKLHSVLFSEVK